MAKAGCSLLLGVNNAFNAPNRRISVGVGGFGERNTHRRPTQHIQRDTTRTLKGHNTHKREGYREEYLMREFSRDGESSLNSGGQFQGSLSATEEEDCAMTEASGESSGSDCKLRKRERSSYTIRT